MGQSENQLDETAILKNVKGTARNGSSLYIHSILFRCVRLSKHDPASFLIAANLIFLNFLLCVITVERKILRVSIMFCILSPCNRIGVHMQDNSLFLYKHKLIILVPALYPQLPLYYLNISFEFFRLIGTLVV